MNVLKKVVKKVENSKIVKNPKFLVIGLIIIVSIIALIYFIFLKYSPIMNFKYEGYAISGKEITENLLSGESPENNANKNIELTKIEEQGTIFKKLNDYFVGSKEKTEINLNYPIYINGNSSLYNLSEGSTLISKNFEEISGYPNLSISEGKIYDGNNLERADAKEYIFVKTTDNIYINLYEIKVKTTANEYTIPVNSIIAFAENSIRYYSINNNVLVFNQINDIDDNSNVEMVENGYTYKELLTRLGILQEESNNTESSNSQENIIQENTANEKVTEDNENKNNEQQNTDNNTSDQNGYIKPEVRAEDFTAEVYTAKSILHIKDPSGRIIEAPTFEIYKDGKIYLRRTFSNSGEIQITGLIPDTEYEVIGKYIYLNENNQKIENTFYEGRLTTKGYDQLGSIEIQKENGEIYSNKIQLTKVKITSDLNAEVIKGINQVEIETGEIRTVLKNSQVNSLLRGEEITIESSEGLKSDSKINYKIKFYDKNGIELKVNNNEGETRTSKQAPTARVSINEQDIVSVTLRLNLTNKDNVELENYKYVVTRPNGEVVQEKRLAKNETELLLEDLDQNQYYKIGIYADYDLNDNKGKQENVEIGNLVFATQPISTLGSLKLIVENKELTSTTSMISYKINEDRTDKRLIQILNELTINIKDGENIVRTDTLTEKEITNLQQAGSKEIKYENLKSNTTYTIEITGNVQLGNTQEEIPITYNYKEFTTLKIPAKVEIRNQFVTGNLIDFDVRIEDINNAVLNNKVRMELRNSSNDLIDLQELTSNEEYIRKTYEKLEENQTYKLSFYADQYNEGSTDATYKVNYLITELEIVTEPGISGEIGLTELTRKATGKNLVDVESNLKWNSSFTGNIGYGKEYDKENKILSIKAQSNGRSQRYMYNLSEYIGQNVTISFEAKIDEKGGDLEVYFRKSLYTNNVKIDDLTKYEWQKYSYAVTVDSTGYIGFYLHQLDSNTNGGILQLKNLQIELGNNATEYEEYKYELEGDILVNLTDKRGEIQTNDYVVRIYKNNEVVSNNRYLELENTNTLTNVIKQYTLDQNCDYKVELVVNVNEREYVLDYIEFNTNGTAEIKGIRTKEEFLNIQPQGNYIVLTDIDIGEENITFGDYFPEHCNFNGTIDFNGNKISMVMTSGYSIFTNLKSQAVIKNLVLDLKIKNEIPRNSFKRLVGRNYGTIQNLKVILSECVNIENTNISLIASDNYNTISNFEIFLEKPIYGKSQIGLVCQNNYGTIKNGYIHGENIKMPYELTDGSHRNTAVVAPLNRTTGKIMNVYSLVNIEVPTKDNYVGNMVSSGLDSSYVQNTYVVENDEAGTQNINYSTTTNNNKNNYYFGKQEVNSNNQKTSMLSLKEASFQNQILNSENAFNVDELIEQGYYPQLNFPDCMPNQTYIKLPEIEDADLPDILSSEVIEENINEAKVRLVINNPNSETMENLKVKDIECEILNQEYSEGKTTLEIRLYNPIRYLSKYSILNLSTKGAFNATYTRDFNENERIIVVSLYKEVASIDDWKEINNSPEENYMLTEDLNFMNQADSVILNNEFKGRLNGNNHTIKNIFTNSYLIKTLKGTIENLVLENIQLTNKNINSIQSGVIQTATDASINNISINGETIEIPDTYNGVVKTGGIIAVGTNVNITNSSITNFNFSSEKKLSQVSVGGIVGESTRCTIQNSFVQDIQIAVKDSIASNGVGGICGKDSDSITINKCYVIGNINANVQYIGGIIGNSTNVDIQNCYTKVKIQSREEYLGGIVGSYSSTVINIRNNISLGNLYSEKVSENINSIVGLKTYGKNNNYAYENQFINGTRLEDSSDSEFVSLSELKSEEFYRIQLNWKDLYDISKVNNNVLPKLYFDNQNTLLKNQKDNLIADSNNMYIENVDSQKESNDRGSVRVVLNNPNAIDIENIKVDNMETNITRNINLNGKTYLDLEVTPKGFYDSYKISGITYKNENDSVQLDVEGRIEMQFFKELYTYEDWQNIEDGTYQNYRLMNDIDFKNNSDVKSNVTMSKLEADNMYTLKNVTIEADQDNCSLIERITGDINNIRFENVDILNNSNYNTIGVIANNLANIQNLEFNDITIDAKNSEDVGCIAKNYGETIENINLDNINIIGKTNVGGFIGHQYELHDGNITNITANNITILGTVSYTGGIIGYIKDHNTYLLSNLEVKESNIKGNNYVGGVIGNGKGNTFTVTNSKVEGNNYVGGVIGVKDYFAWGNASKGGYYIADNVEIYGNSYVGAIGGQVDNIQDSYVNECTITCTSANGSNIGGMAGYASSISNSAIENSKVQSNATNVGAITGYADSPVRNFAYNVKVEGYSNVGGVAGYFPQRDIRQNYVKVDLVANGHSVGGIVGNLHNGNIPNTSDIHSNYIADSTIKGQSNVGGIIGEIAADLYEPEIYYYGNYVEADLESEDNTTVSLGIGNREDQNQYLANTYYYKYSTINGENPNAQNEVFISQTSYLVEADLKQQETYITKLKYPTSYWDFNLLTDGKYPTLKEVKVVEQEGIDIPKDSEHIIESEDSSVDAQSIETQEIPEQIFEYNNKTIQTYSTYSVITSLDRIKATRNAKLYVKDNKLYAIPSVLSDSANSDEIIVPVADNLILDSYNGKEYETVLGSDGKIYDLKEPIEYPENFVNSDIESIGNNLNSDVKEVEVIYKNGDSIKFNYQTGEIISSSKAEDKEKTGLFAYLKEKIAEIGETSVNGVSQEITNKYEESKELQTKLEETSVEEAIEKQNGEASKQVENIGNKSVNTEDVTTTEANTTQEINNNATNNSYKENKYISMYNEETGQYEIYSEEELLDTTKEEVVSENEKIEANNLSEYYASEGETKNTKMGIVWIVISIIGVGIILFVLRKNLRKGK